MNPLPFICFCLWAGFALPMAARDLPAYRVGDVADADILTPMPLDVPDAAATTALQLAKAQQFPAVFRSLPAATNETAQDFLAAFAQARTNFLAELAGEFHRPSLDAATIASADFGRLVTAFGVENRNFPVPDELAAEWARGTPGETIRDQLLARLLRQESSRLSPDTLPKGMVIADAIRLVPVADADERLSFDTVQQGQIVPAASLMTVSNAQTALRREFPAGEQLFARALAAFLRPNCLPDAPFTQLTRGAAVYQVVVANHFDAGDAIVRQGDKIDAKAKLALTALSEKLRAATPAPTPPPVVASVVPVAHPAPTRVPVPVAAPVLAPVVTPAPTPSPVSAVVAPVVASTAPKATAAPHLRHEGLILALAGASAVALLVAGWQFWREKKRAAATASTAQVPLPFPEGPRPDLTPQVAQAVREAVQQELALQRRELLLAQQAATDEIAALVKRLDELQVPMQQRLQTYEDRIQTLEKELALRNEENRELLKAKLEMVRRQLATEQAAALVPPLTVQP